MTGLGPPFSSNADQFGWSSGQLPSSFSSSSFIRRDPSPVPSSGSKIQPSTLFSPSSNSLDQSRTNDYNDLFTGRSTPDYILRASNNKYPSRIGPPNSISSNNANVIGLNSQSRIPGLIHPPGASQKRLDQEFPTLGKAPPPVISNQGMPTGSRPNFLSAANKNVHLSHEEFIIQQEDFPALPGTLPSSGMSSSMAQNATSADGGVDPSVAALTQGSSTIRTLPGGIVTGIPASMVRDQFGMVGLLSLIRAGEDNPNLSVIAPGIDLNNLGLPLNNSTEIYSCLGSPWSEPCLARPQYIDYPVPGEYLVGAYIKEKLPPPPLDQLQVETLFWLFYNCTCDALQLSAAKELHRRDWRWIKSEKLWVTRSGHGHEKLTGQTAERGVYYYWDIKSWSRQQKQFTIYYEHIDNTPNSYPDPPVGPSQPPQVNLS